MIERFAKVHQSGDQKLAASRVIGNILVKVLRSKRPPARYHGGTIAGPILFLRAWLSDRMLDRLIGAIFVPRRQ